MTSSDVQRAPLRTDGLPWYRHPLVWLIIAIPMSSVIVGITMLVVSVRTYDGLVTDDYYKRGMEINQSLARDGRAHELGLSASVSLLPDAVRVSFRRAPAAPALPPELSLRLSHSTRGGLDKILSLRAVSDGDYVAPAVGLEPGRWYVEVGDVSWRLTGALSGGQSRLELESGE